MINRELIKGTLKYLVMNLLRNKSRMYGYEITRLLEEQTGGRIKLTFSALYPVLHKLEAEGLLKTETVNVNNRTRKYYSLTAAGTREATARVEEFSEYLILMQSLINPHK